MRKGPTGKGLFEQLQINERYKGLTPEAIELILRELYFEDPEPVENKIEKGPKKKLDI